MQYMGGKERIHKDIVGLIRLAQVETGATNYLEPFLGGASIGGRAARHFATATLSDYDPLVASLWSAVGEGWVPPTNLSEEEYDGLQMLGGSSPLEAFAAFGASFGGKKWGGYARDNNGRDYAAAAARGIDKKAQGLSHATILQGSYSIHCPGEATVVYCDPPYAGSTGYGVEFDHAKFWATMDKWVDRGAVVLVSEYQAPPHWVSIFEKNKGLGLRHSAKTHGVEKVFTRNRYRKG